ncbi:hypothetical protein AAKU52_001057 [Pedobacter sp. CG_S7]
MKLFLFFLLTPLMLKTSVQVRFTKDLNPFIRKEHKKIRNLGSDTIIIYEQYCVGCETISFIKDGSREVGIPRVYEEFIRGL